MLHHACTFCVLRNTTSYDDVLRYEAQKSGPVCLYNKVLTAFRPKFVSDRILSVEFPVSVRNYRKGSYLLKRTVLIVK